MPFETFVQANAAGHSLIFFNLDLSWIINTELNIFSLKMGIRPGERFTLFVFWKEKNGGRERNVSDF